MTSHLRGRSGTGNARARARLQALVEAARRSEGLGLLRAVASEAHSSRRTRRRTRNYRRTRS